MEERMNESEGQEDKFQIHLICLEDGIEVLNLLPFHAYYHELKEEDLISIFSVHRGCADFKLPNVVDIYISTTDGFVDSSIGRNFGAKEKIGFSSSLNNWFLTKKINKLLNKHKSEQVCELVKPLTGYISQIPICSSRILEVPDEKLLEKTYIVLDLDLIEDEVNPVWRELFELVNGAHFVLSISQADEFKQELRLASFIKSLPKKNKYEFVLFSDYIEYAKHLVFSKGFATSNKDLMLLSSYCGKKTIFFNKDYNFSRSGSQYLKGEVVNTLITDYDDSDGFSKGFDQVLEILNSIEKDSD